MASLIPIKALLCKASRRINRHTTITTRQGTTKISSILQIMAFKTGRTEVVAPSVETTSTAQTDGCQDPGPTPHLQHRGVAAEALRLPSSPTLAGLQLPGHAAADQLQRRHVPSLRHYRQLTRQLSMLMIIHSALPKTCVSRMKAKKRKTKLLHPRNSLLQPLHHQSWALVFL